MRLRFTKKIMFGITVLIALAIGFEFVLAQTDSVAVKHSMPLPQPHLSSNGFGLVLFRTLLSLAFVVALVYIVMIGLRRLIGRDVVRPQGAMKVVGSLPLGMKKNLLVVQIEKRRLVIGVTEQNINLICELDGTSQDVLQDMETAPAPSDTGKGFQTMLKQLIHKRDNTIET